MLVFVDYEHPEGFDREFGQRIQAARTWITYRLEDISGMHCMLVRYNRVDEALLDKLDAKAIFISGNATAFERYEPAALEPLMQIIRTTKLPIFGFCGGFQLTAQALGSPVVPIEPGPELAGHENLISLDDGQPFEFGYHPVQLNASASAHPLLGGIEAQPVFRHAHGLHVPTPPNGFEVLASNDITAVQLAVNDERKIAGTQFHPEYWTDEAPAGRRLIANFLAWSGVVDASDVS